MFLGALLYPLPLPSLCHILLKTALFPHGPVTPAAWFCIARPFGPVNWKTNLSIRFLFGSLLCLYCIDKRKKEKKRLTVKKKRKKTRALSSKKATKKKNFIFSRSRTCFLFFLSCFLKFSPLITSAQCHLGRTCIDINTFVIHSLYIHLCDRLERLSEGRSKL